jgi:hypothetical protein
MPKPQAGLDGMTFLGLKTVDAALQKSSIACFNVGLDLRSTCVSVLGENLVCSDAAPASVFCGLFKLEAKMKMENE